MTQAQLKLGGAVTAEKAEDLFQPAGEAEEELDVGPPPSSRSRATLDHLEKRYRQAGQPRGYIVCGADHLVRDPLGRTTEVWRFHPDSTVWLELVEVRRDAAEEPEDLQLRITAAEVQAA